MHMLTEERNSFCYIYGAEFCDFKDHHEVDAGEKVMDSVDLLLSHTAHNVSCLSNLENTSHEIFLSNDMDDFCDMTKKIINVVTIAKCSILCFKLPHVGKTKVIS